MSSCDPASFGSACARVIPPCGFCSAGSGAVCAGDLSVRVSEASTLRGARSATVRFRRRRAFLRTPGPPADRVPFTARSLALPSLARHHSCVGWLQTPARGLNQLGYLVPDFVVPNSWYGERHNSRTKFSVNSRGKTTGTTLCFDTSC